MSAVRQVFVGWTEPVLRASLRYFSQEADAVLSDLTIVVPNDRARSAFLHALVRAAEGGNGGRAFVAPPVVLTLRDLPESLYLPEVEIAGELEELLSWSIAIGRSPASRIRRAFGPGAADGARRWEQARQLSRLREELSEWDLRFRDVSPRAVGRLEGFRESRWEALSELDELSIAILESWGVNDALRARRRALEGGRFLEGGLLALLAADELGSITSRLLESCARPIDVLVPAPSSERHLFDGWGRPRAPKWVERRLPLGRAAVRIVDRPLDQAREVLSQVIERKAPRVSVAVGGGALRARLERCFDLANVARASVRRRSATEPAPYSLLRGLSRFLERRRLDDLCWLVRDPDLESSLSRSMPSLVMSSKDRRVAACLENRDWLTLLDLYSTETLELRVDGEWPGDEAAGEAARRLTETVLALLELNSFEEGDREQQLGEQSSRLGVFLESVYGDREFVPGEAGSDATVGALRLLAEVLSEQSAPRTSPSDEVLVSLAEAVQITLQRASGRRLPMEVTSETANVQLLEWDDILLDDSETAIVVGLNEGGIPARPLAGGLLSEALREVLGVRDAASRYARDLFVLEHLLMSRSVTLISGRRDGDDDPLVPSRLLLACESGQLPRTVLEFYGSAVRGGHAAIVGHSLVGELQIPRPDAGAAAPTRFSVTSFRDYLSCPYRFYLRHVLRLSERRDLPAELSPASFGGLAHEVLRRFGLGPAGSSEEPRVVRDALETLLAETVEERLGSSCRVAARVQVEQLRRRLASFATWQAGQVSEGWRLDPEAVELSLESSLVVDGESVEVRGRIDRVDRHPEHGVRVLDYKTGERSREVERAHFRIVGGCREWHDLQLPLYRFLLSGREEVAELGFVNLTQDLGGEMLSLASFDPEAHAEALEVAREVVRSVRRGDFWPPSDPPSYDDGFRRVAGDLWEERPSLIGGP